MKKRVWLLLCLIALEGIFLFSEWRCSLSLARMHTAAIQLHMDSDQLLRGSKKPAIVEQARALDATGWSLIGEGQEVRRQKFIWQVFSLMDIVMMLGFGVWWLRLATVEMTRRTEAEAELRLEQTSLEGRIDSRTAELQAEVEERRRAEERNRHQKRVLELLANGAPLDKMFAELTASIAGQRRSWEAAVHLVDGATGTLKLLGSSRVSGWLEHYLETIVVGFSDAPESLACTSGEPSFVGSMMEQHRPWSEFLLSNGVRSVWSLPLVLSDGSIAGTLSVYSRLMGLPDEADRELLDSAVRLSTLVIDVHRLNRELQRKAFEDELTGVANRHAGENWLKEAIARAHSSQSPFAVLWIDLDRFKRINDLYGHGKGDQVLMQAARRISSHPRVNGAVARMGGDEFLVLLEPSPTEEDARQISGEIAALIREPMNLGAEIAAVGASIGITLCPRDGETPEELERYADAAMYQAKRHGLGSCVFSPALRKESQWKLAIEEGLRAALDPERQGGLLRLVYQPILKGAGELQGFEALLRFTHPDLGPVSPAKFIPVAEESSLINGVGRWVMREACRQIKEWQLDETDNLRIGVNISAVQFGREDFVAEFQELVRESGIRPTLLTLELTESALMQSPARAREHMTQLKAMGVRLAMDDFGTGYSSLSYLHQLPLDVLKIDRSFVARLAKKDDSRAIVESVISMAHLLHLKTVAEGVETSVQRDLLTRMRCDAMQGFLFSRPLSADDAAKFMKPKKSQAAMPLPMRAVAWWELPAEVEIAVV